MLLSRDFGSELELSWLTDGIARRHPVPTVMNFELRRRDEAISLAAKAFDLLVFMAANPGRLLPKSELLTAVWPDAFVEESNLTRNQLPNGKSLIYWVWRFARISSG